jgi:cell fate regulator YaaT (PSP1 superfamily)
MNLDLTPNKKLVPIVDCLGTCKTPIGCTCGKKKPKDDADSKVCTCGKNPGGACGCKTGEGCGCGTKTASGEKDCGGCSNKSRCSCTKGTHKLEVFDWLCDLPESQQETQMVEVQFKNTRKGYYLNSNNLELFKGDIVAVEATPGHDIGEVTLTGKLVLLQMKKNNYRVQQGEQKRVYRIAKPLDMEKYQEAKALEHKTMIRAREIAEELGLNMKISDVEYQGDGNKAIFYYIADERVDFRQLIKVYAEQFRVKIEMKQIGARQEAGRVGGIGPCGRELCCSSSMSNFVSVSTSAARFQDISLNPQKLAGQCGKLKCCLNYEVDTYVEAQKKLPSKEIVLETKDGSFFHFKTDILSGTMTYSSDKYMAANLVSMPKERVFDIIRMNKNGQRPLKLAVDGEEQVEKNVSKDILEQENINRFDSNQKRKKKKLTRIDKNEEGDNNKPQRQPQVQKKVIQPVKEQVEGETQDQTQSRNNNKNRNRQNNNRNRNRPVRNGENRNNGKEKPQNEA